ncbi:MAG: hypothetical protein EOP04_11890 [Proteobacteria bacterium]|nr:MAG: hypothetical protein EOP04_11890 [Pseudomonadota bacterium]
MKSKAYFDLCTRKLAVLATEVELRGSVNILDVHVHCEDFYARFLNLLFGYSLENLNATQQNSAGIDLIDKTGKIVLQVSSTATFDKVQTALSHTKLAGLKGYLFKFVSIAKDASDLRKKVFDNPHGLNFSPIGDIIDLKSITTILLHSVPSKQKQIYSFLHEELPLSEVEPPSETNIAALINILSAEDLSPHAQSGSPIPFSIDDKLVFNNLVVAKELVENYAVYQPRIDALYASFDAAGKNRSTSVLGTFHSIYLKLKKDGEKDDDLFFSIIEAVMEAAKKSANYVAISEEELELCIQILAVDAFMKCRIFKRPPMVTANASA